MIDNEPKENTYSTKEASEIIGIKERAIQTRCKLDNVRKKNNKYLITDSLIALWKQKEDEANATQTQKTNATQLDLEVESLKEKIKELENELQRYEIGENERIEVFSNENYKIFEQRLKDWYTLQKDIEHQQQLFNVENKGLNEIIEHYKNQFEYQKEQSTRILDIHERLIEAVNTQNKITLQRNFIEAKTAGFDKED
jgi:signal transduction protein with GAF and PtsI domain